MVGRGGAVWLALSMTACATAGEQGWLAESTETPGTRATATRTMDEFREGDEAPPERPDGEAPDEDLDGIADVSDLCPDRPEDWDNARLRLWDPPIRTPGNVSPHVPVPRVFGAMRGLTSAWVLGCLVAFSVGCKGGGGGGSGDSADDTAGDDGDTGEDGGSCEAFTPEFAPLRRMTAAQFANTVRDLFGETIDPGTDFPIGTRSEGFSTDAAANVVTDFGAQGIFDAAEHVSAQVVQNLEPLFDCAVTAVDDTCARTMIENVGMRAFRRPLEADELETLHAMWTGAPADFTTAERTGMVVEALLQSPQFLYLTQGGGVETEEVAPDGSSVVRLTDWEIATRLSYLIWETMPDATLFAQAEAGLLHEAEDIETQVRAMLDDPRAERGLLRFHEEWLYIENVPTTNKDIERFPMFDEGLAAAMAEEAQRYVLATVMDGEGTLTDLLAGDTTFVNGPLAELYGIDAPGATADTWVEVPLPSNRRGMLTQGGFLAAHSHLRDTGPVIRGAFVQEEVLCFLIAPPPPGIDTTLPQPVGGETMRDVLEEHRANPACAGCHDYIDPVGLAFENYDAIGGFRTEENGSPIDASGELPGKQGPLGTFDDAVGMVSLIAESEQSHECYSLKWLHFAHGEVPSGDASCLREDMGDRFFEAGGDIRELIVAVTTSDTFRYRRAPEGD